MSATCVFLSYSRTNSDYARALHDRLELARVTVWWDQEELPGEDWTEQLLAWLEGADAVVVIVSQHSAISPSVKNEVLLAQDYQRRVIPVVLEQTRGGLWVLIRSLQWVDAREGRDPLPDLLRALHAGQRDPRPGPTDVAFTADVAMQPYDPPPASVVQAQVTIVLPGEIQAFSDRDQLGLVQIIARFARLSPDQIKVVRLEAGSVRVTLELPESTARWLVEMYERRSPLIELLDIQAVRDLRVLPARNALAGPPAAPGVVSRLAGWFAGWTRTRSFALAGALAAVLIVALLVNMLRGPALPNGTLVGVITDVQGALEVQGAGWNAFVPVSAGAQLRAGDRLRLGPGAQARAVCADGAAVALETGAATAVCGAAADPLLFDIAQAQWANAVLGAADDTVPQVITPRASALLTTTPAIRWTAVAGAITYTVTLRRDGKDAWSVKVSGVTSLAYPAGQPPLEPGALYRFVVTAENGAEENAQGAGVQVLDAEEAGPVRAEVQKVERLGLDEDTTRLLLANLYARHGLYAEALALLEPPAATAGHPAALRLLGDLYLAVGLPNLAVAPYTQELEAAQNAGDRLGQAETNRMLGMVYSRLGGAENLARARTSYQRALQFYQEVGDADAQKELQQRLADLG